MIPLRKGRYRKGERIAGTQYRFVRELGKGAHGEVYEVEHTFLQARGVMKLLHENLVARADVAKRMRREARMLAQLRHPNIVEVRDGGISAEPTPRPYFVMEALSGVSLRTLLDRLRGGLGVSAALRLVAGILDGLHHAHRAGVVHRDVKPDNVFLHRTASDVTVPKILDFGVAHLLLPRSVTGRGFLGTPRYAAPEQIGGMPPSEATDVYAAGLLLFELLTGQPPFAGLFRMSALAEAHQRGAPLRPSAFDRNAPRELDDLVALLCAKAPERRPPTAFAAAVAVRDVRARLEARAEGALHARDFATEPSPMDDALQVAASACDLSLVTQQPESARGAPPLPVLASRTVRMRNVLPTEVLPERHDARAESRFQAHSRGPSTLATLPSAEHVPALARALRRATGPIHRAALTHTAAISAPRPRAANDTQTTRSAAPRTRSANDSHTVAIAAPRPHPTDGRRRTGAPHAGIAPAGTSEAWLTATCGRVASGRTVPAHLATTASTRRAPGRRHPATLAALVALAAAVGASLAGLLVLVIAAGVPGEATLPASLVPVKAPPLLAPHRQLDQGPRSTPSAKPLAARQAGGDG